SLRVWHRFISIVAISFTYAFSRSVQPRDLPRLPTRRSSDLFNFDRSVVARFDDGDIAVHAARDTGATRTGPARTGRGVAGRAVDRLGHGHSDRALADALRPREQQALRQRVAPNGRRQESQDRTMPDDVAERHPLIL